MKKVLIVIGALFGIFVALTIITGTSLVGEVVTLHTRDSEGEWQTTPLWVVDFDDVAYLRASTPDGSGWVTRLRANPDAKFERADAAKSVKLVEEPARTQAVHQKMAEKYGWANDFVALLSGDRSQSIALRVSY